METVVKKLLLILYLIILISNATLADEKILVVQSARIAPYEEALKGFLSIAKHNMDRIVLSESKTEHLTENIIKAYPSLILAIGRDALLHISGIRNIPIVYIMVLNPQSIVIQDENFYGVLMSIDPERQLDIFLKAVPELNNIGLIYNSNNTGELAEKAIYAAKNKGIQLIHREAAKANDVPSIIKDMADKIGAFWMLPDTTLMTSEAIDFLLITSIEKSIPILTFSDKYVDIGALMSVAVDPYDMGKQAGEVAEKILDHDIQIDFKRIFPRKAVISINRKIAKKLDIELNQKFNPDLYTNK